MFDKLETIVLNGRTFYLVPVQLLDAFDGIEPVFASAPVRTGNTDFYGNPIKPDAALKVEPPPRTGGFDKNGGAFEPPPKTKRVKVDLGEREHRQAVRDAMPETLKARAPQVHKGKAPAQAGDDTTRGKILAVLSKGPRSSIELTSELKLEMSVISPACAAMKSQGRIEAKEDPNFGMQRRWFLIPGAGEAAKA